MPTYEYRRKDGSTFEIEQRITEEPLKECPTTGQPVTRLISAGAGLVFKGSGFYLTDYARAGKNGRASGSVKSTGTGATAGESKAAAEGTDAKPSESSAASSTSGGKKAE